jgi:hypothetical protein
LNDPEAVSAAAVDPTHADSEAASRSIFIVVPLFE